ncbi:MAG TPA: 16S rRNA (guanine(966)-N(2))-methyltransferase RsmD [Rhodanobacteraceae bacterium]|nr:16S rRNA (guanine(966)-N(2))-methyltransferase RsmD [Rhodanobacteraceae bacterium]
MKRGHRNVPPGAVRVIGGSLRGSRLGVPALADLRPTPARLRETLFNWLMPEIEGARVLDPFAGSGVLGIESLSRGAAHALMIERDRGQAARIAADLERLHARGGEVRCADALHSLGQSPAQRFDIAFLDPPFEADLWTRAAASLEEHGWLAPRAYVYVEMPSQGRFAPPPHWNLHRQARAGAVSGALYLRDQSLPT